MQLPDRIVDGVGVVSLLLDSHRSVAVAAFDQPEQRVLPSGHVNQVVLDLPSISARHAQAVRSKLVDQLDELFPRRFDALDLSVTHEAAALRASSITRS